jgi:hypothetical protein
LSLDYYNFQTISAVVNTDTLMKQQTTNNWILDSVLFFPFSDGRNVQYKMFANEDKNIVHNFLNI